MGSKPCVYVKFEATARVVLPDKKIDDGKGNVTAKAKERATEAAGEALPQTVYIYLDGEDKEPVEVSIEVDGFMDDAEVWVE